MEIRSKLLARVTQLPYNVSPDYLAFKKLEIATTVKEVPDLSVPAPTPWWVYLLGIILGILLLALLIYLLYKVSLVLCLDYGDSSNGSVLYFFLLSLFLRSRFPLSLF